MFEIEYIDLPENEKIKLLKDHDNKVIENTGYKMIE